MRWLICVGLRLDCPPEVLVGEPITHSVTYPLTRVGLVGQVLHGHDVDKL